jgi:pyruvate formate lyase activating enzyme
LQYKYNGHEAGPGTELGKKVTGLELILWSLEVILLVTGIVFNIQRYSIHDGPGIRTTVFLKGCPLECWWCHNPESQNMKKEIVFWPDRCIGCGDCALECPNNAIDFAEGMPEVIREKCCLCGRCADKCPTGAQEMIGKEVTSEEVMKEILKDMVFYDESGGGVTFSGGEPLAQPQFLNQLLKNCKQKAIHTALDTSGYVSWEILDNIRRNVDLFLYDIKHVNSEKHKKFTGVENEIILENLKRLAKVHRNIVIRVPVIPGFNDGEEDVLDIGEFALSLNLRNMNILPYHKTGMDKYGMLQKKYRIPGTEPPSREYMSDLKDRLEGLGLNIKIGG